MGKKKYIKRSWNGNWDMGCCDIWVTNDINYDPCPGDNFALIPDSTTNGTGLAAVFSTNGFIGSADLLGNRYLKEAKVGN